MLILAHLEPSKDVIRVRHLNLFEEKPLLNDPLKLTDPTLITALVERWRSETHNFHLPCGECTITLKDVLLQIGMAHIIYIIRRELLPDKSNNIQLMYLPILLDLKNVHQYSWGSACLANLYRDMCRATKLNAKAISKCLLLLQSWAWYHLSFLAPRVDDLPTYPFASR
ncbi:hypothetical protein Lal_00026432 [Lupinus albus]|nr:hypothetical protein Lal_00026432 [Lupinus albus]